MGIGGTRRFLSARIGIRFGMPSTIAEDPDAGTPLVEQPGLEERDPGWLGGGSRRD